MHRMTCVAVPQQSHQVRPLQSSSSSEIFLEIFRASKANGPFPKQPLEGILLQNKNVNQW